ncbi:MAG: 8-amino-7-oxononanoate synthase [Gemmataceae bacterium]
MAWQWIDEALREVRVRGLYRRRRRVRARHGAAVYMGTRKLIHFASNDYLGLASAPQVVRSIVRAAKRWGCGSSASALISGYTALHRRLERELARWQGTRAALVFPSGYHANLGILTALAGRADAVFSDQLNHASIIDGCRLSRAQVYVYRHTDMDHLEELLRHYGRQARRRIIVSDALFSMDGDLAPVGELLRLAEAYDALVVVDEAHALGVLGSQGRGVCELVLSSHDQQSDHGRLVRVGTLSKALAAQGGFVCGDWSLVRWLVQSARSYIFSTALTPLACAAARAALRVVRTDPARRQYLLELAAYLRGRLREAGWHIGSSQAHIVPVLVGDARASVALSQRLWHHGYFVPAIRPPSVPPGTSRLRIGVTAAHSRDDVDGLVAALDRARAAMGLSQVPSVTLAEDNRGAV